MKPWTVAELREHRVMRTLRIWSKRKRSGGGRRDFAVKALKDIAADEAKR